jgi:iron transport multicopper oxidase
VANFAVDPSSGVFTQSDYFEPYEYQGLDGSDRDFGSSGSCLLDPTTFSGTGVDQMIVAGGKTGKVYVLNADNLGGFAQG